ncbi:MAG: hypothetical protein K0R14_2098 [Burkholderiales bacterium]|jgi:hypothetical protein|nr:hypothetical protein [Burkholderiales bacterium]
MNKNIFIMSILAALTLSAQVAYAASVQCKSIQGSSKTILKKPVTITWKVEDEELNIKVEQEGNQPPDIIIVPLEEKIESFKLSGFRIMGFKVKKDFGIQKVVFLSEDKDDEPWELAKIVYINPHNENDKWMITNSLYSHPENASNSGQHVIDRYFFGGGSKYSTNPDKGERVLCKRI